MQGGSVDVWKENILEDLEAGLLEYEMAGEFLAKIKKRVWRKRWENSQDSRIEEAKTGEKNNRGVCSRVQKSGKRK